MDSTGTIVAAAPWLAVGDGHTDADTVVDSFTDYATASGVEMYPAQEESLLELAAGSNVILSTPTGSGKSLVGEAAHLVALARGERSAYTAPIKALVSEKFFNLCRVFGADRVGMITGDGSVNADAPIICCTAEILANWALRDGAATPIRMIVADEFHFYGDPQRGWAWQVPLLELPDAQFLLMSATLGPTAFFEHSLTELTGRETAHITSVQRPVPLTFEYRSTTLHNSVSELLATGKAPIYLVHFTQRDATEAAQGYLSLDPLTKDEKGEVKELIGGFRFDSPFGQGFRRFLTGGVGVHHAGLLPKYRLLVERLAQAGLLKIICGTDTLGVGVNVPIRSVLFTQLYKYDGNGTRILNVREFQQIAGRAGRRGYDDAGDVWVQAPPHIVENEKNAAAALTDAKKRKKLVKKKPPERNYAHWTKDTFDKLVNGSPEALSSSFAVNHQMVMSLLDRPGDGCAAVRSLLTSNHEPRKRQRQHIRRSIAIYRSLVEAELLEFPDPPDDLGRRVRVTFDLQDEFALHQPLSLWALGAIERLDAQLSGKHTPSSTSSLPGPGAESAARGDTGGEQDVDVAADPQPADTVRSEVDRALAILTIVEALQENPGPVIAAQVRKAKDDLMAEMKSSGVEYEERMARLANVEPPRPHKQWLFSDFNEFRRTHPWAAEYTVKPKSVARELFETSMTFGEYIRHYGLKNSEGVVLRYLSDVYKGLLQNVPIDACDDELDDIIHWLGALVRQVDSSLLDEWERLTDPDAPAGAAVRPGTVAAARAGLRHDAPASLVDDDRAFRTLVRNEAFRWIEVLAAGGRPAARVPDLDVVAALADYWDEYEAIEINGDARHQSRFRYDSATGRIEQTIHDPLGHDEWRLIGQVDLDATRAEDRLVVALTAIERI